MKTLIRTLTTESGGIFAVADGRRIKIGECQLTIHVYKRLEYVPILGQAKPGTKKTYVADAVCSGLEPDLDVPRGTSRIELVGEFQRQDGVFESIRLDNTALNEIDPRGDWYFDIIGSRELILKLSEF
jgi:hypothetical protein